MLDLRTLIGELPIGTVVYSCGPERLLEALETECENLPENALHIERFRARVGAESIIDALDRSGIHIPRSCGEGTCGTCITPVVEGIPDHRDSFLIGKKRAGNKCVSVCCPRSVTARLVLDI